MQTGYSMTPQPPRRILERNCLHNSEGKVSYEQCCDDNSKTTDSVHNPYYQKLVADPDMKKEDCQALIDVKSAFPDHESNTHPAWDVQAGSTPDAKDNGKSWYKTLVSHGTCELQLVLWSNPLATVT
jgi:hypothetical protein